MLVCPECRKGPLPESTGTAIKCSACGTTFGVKNDIFRLVKGSSDRTRQGYQELYDRIAREDLANPVMEQGYAAALNESTAIALGDVRGKHGCEIGVGTGHLLRQMLGRGAKMTALDLAAPYLEALVGYGDLRRIQADAEHMPFADEFDFVTCTDVLEHVLNTGNLLYCINEALKPHGLLAIRVPADENLLVYCHHLGCKYDYVHLRSFTRDGLTAMIEGAGFKIHKIFADGHGLTLQRPLLANNDRMLSYEIDHVRQLLLDKGVSPADFLRMPSWFREQLSKAYFYLVIAERTHRIVPSASSGFELVPLG